jgi:myo-inositol-1(or 4)-monophosphatase
MSDARILEIAVAIAREAGELLLGFVGKTLAVEHKGAVDLVTRADRASERLIVSRIREAFPEHAILAEEGGGRDARDPATHLWVVDPLDGTTNFAHGLPIWAVSIAVLAGGKPLVGVVLDPCREECFAARRGAGALLNGSPIEVSAVSDLQQALCVTGFPYDVRTHEVNNLDHFENFMRATQAVRRLGSAALDLCYVACGRFDGFWELKLHPWDVAAGGLIVEEAGGVVTDFSGGEFDVFADEVLASTPALAAPMREVLARGKRPSP